ncbi:MAG TPA: serine/threonine-protein kinase, partial [Polyangiaceae bacterium]|nr:serine/threonine-protein kinase [Polyangiaceae bacterium]
MSSDPANDDELVNDDELLFERDPFPAPEAAASTNQPLAGARISVPPPLPPLSSPPRTSNLGPTPPVSRERSRPPHRDDSRHASREDARYSSEVDSTRTELRRPSHIDELRPSLREMRDERSVRDERSAKEDSPLRSGDMIAGKYQVERVVGRVGVGIVAQVRHADLGQRFRLKYLPLELCEAPDAVSRFLRGARRAMRLQSEHTARTVDAGRLPNGSPYVVTEANSGSEMRDVMRVRGLLTVTEAVDFVLQASESLAEAHAQGLIHKNLNLSTLFLTWRPDGSHSIKVQDFGVAESLRADPLRTSDFNGEPVTMFDSSPVEALGCLSPEQIRSYSEIEVGADVWALGCILHQFLTGFPVFTATTVPGLLASIVADPATPITALRSDVPAGLERVILRCLEKNRGGRFQSLADLASALRPFASPDTQASADRITRTLGRAQQVPPGVERQFAMVHVGPAVVSQGPTAAPVAGSAVVPYPLVWSVALIAVGLIGGTIAGLFVATRLPAPQATLEPSFNAQQAARIEVPRPLSASQAVNPAPTIGMQLATQPTVAAQSAVQPPVAQPGVARPPAAPPAAPVAPSNVQPSAPSNP